MAFRLFINNEEADVDPNVRISFTFQVNDIAEMKDRQGSFSNQFKLRKTRKNARLLGNANVSFSSNPSRWRRVPARAEDDGGTVTTNGFLIITMVDEFFNVVFYAGILDMFSKIGEKMLTELDLVSLRHIWNEANVIASYSSSDNPYCYAPADYGGTITGLTLDYLKLGMWHKGSFLVEKIIEEAGYSVAGSFLSNSDYKSVYIFGQKPEYDSNLFVGEMRVSDADSLTTVWPSIPTIGHAPVFSNIDEPLASSPFPGGQFDDVITVPISTLLPGLTQDYSGIKFKANGLYTIEADIRFNMDYGLLINHQPLIRSFFTLITSGGTLQQNGTTQANLDASNWSGFISSGVYQQPPFGEEKKNVIRFQVQANSGDTLIYFSQDIGGVVTGQPILMSNKSFIKITEVQDTELSAGSWVDVASSLPDTSQTNWLKTMAQLFALTFNVEITTKTCTLTQFNELYANKGISRDWGSKLINIDKAKSEFKAPYSKKNTVSFSNEEDLAETRGSGYFLIDDETLPDQQEIFQIPFSGSEEFSHVSGIKSITFPGYDLLEGKFLELTKRIAFIKYDGTGLAITVNGTAVPTPYPQIWFSTVDRIENLDFQNYLFQTYYNKLIEMMNQYLKFTGEFLLKPIDVYRFNHFIPVYIPQLLAYFYVNKILAYTPSVPTKVELIRM